MSWKSYYITEQIWIKEMFSLFKTHFENTYEFQGEAHDFWECLYVISGSLCVSADERVYDLKAGDIIFHKPLEFHKFYITSEAGTEIFVFSFSMEGALADFFSNKVFRLSAMQKDIIARIIDYVEEKQEVAEFYESTYNSILEMLEKYPIYLQNVVLQICRFMLCLIEESCIEKASASPDAVIFRKAVGYMNDSIYDNASVDSIAQHCNISVSGLKRIFAKFAGIGIHKYFLLLKLKEARKMLYRGDTVSNVANALGFSSQAYFSKTYKREMGVSPSVVKG